MEEIQETIGGKMRTLAALFSMFLCFAAHGQQTQTNFRFGARPETSIFDPTSVLTLDEHKRISQPLREILKNEGLDVIIVVLPDIGDAPPQHVAKGFAEKWATTSVNSVVLHVPGHDGSPWIFPGNVMTRAIKPDHVRATLDAAEDRAAAEPTDYGKVRAASIEAADAMRYWLGGTLLRTEDLINRRLEWQLARERRERMLKLSAVLGAASLIPLAFGTAFLVIRIRARTPKRFPPLRKIARLGAPYAGGNSNCSKPVR